MSKDVCMDCGMLMSPRSRICQVCGFDNSHDAGEPQDAPIVSYEEGVPENYPGF